MSLAGVGVLIVLGRTTVKAVEAFGFALVEARIRRAAVVAVIAFVHAPVPTSVLRVESVVQAVFVVAVVDRHRDEAARTRDDRDNHPFQTHMASRFSARHAPRFGIRALATWQQRIADAWRAMAEARHLPVEVDGGLVVVYVGDEELVELRVSRRTATRLWWVRRHFAEDDFHWLVVGRKGPFVGRGWPRRLFDAVIPSPTASPTSPAEAQ